MSQSNNFPTTLGASTPGGGQDAFVARLDPSKSGAQQLLAATFIGGNNNEWGNDVSVGSYITMVGSSVSPNFPTTTNAYDRTHNGSIDAIAVVLDLSLSTVHYSTYLGGSGWDAGFFGESATGSSEIVFVCQTRSSNFPMTSGAFDSTKNGGDDVTVAKIDWSLQPSNQLVYSTHVGGANFDRPEGLSVDASGKIWFCGFTESNNSFPTTQNAMHPSPPGGTRDAYIACIDPSKTQTSSLFYSTFIGGFSTDHCRTVHVDAAGVITAGGNTSSSNFPRTNDAYQTTFRSCPPRDCVNAFLIKVDPSLPASQQLLYSTFFGGPTGYSATSVEDVHVDAAGIITFTGEAWETLTLPTTFGAHDRTGDLQHDTVLARLDPSLAPQDQLLYSTFLGGRGADYVSSLAGVNGTVATIAGVTNSASLRTPVGAYQSKIAGAEDGFIAQIDIRPAMRSFGTGCAGSGTSTLTLTANSNAYVGNQGFVLRMTGGPPGAGLFALSGGELSTPVPLAPSCSLLIDPNPALFVLAPTIQLVLVATIPNTPSLLGTRAFWQGAVDDAAAGSLATSNGLEALITW